MLPELWSRPCGRCAGCVLSDLCPAGDCPCLPGWQGPVHRAQASIRAPPPDSVTGVARPFLGPVPRCPLPTWASLATLSARSCGDGAPGRGEGLLRRLPRQIAA